jgi:hypothetical protein
MSLSVQCSQFCQRASVDLARVHGCSSPSPAPDTFAFPSLLYLPLFSRICRPNLYLQTFSFYLWIDVATRCLVRAASHLLRRTSRITSVATYEPHHICCDLRDDTAVQVNATKEKKNWTSPGNTGLEFHAINLNYTTVSPLHYTHIKEGIAIK